MTTYTATQKTDQETADQDLLIESTFQLLIGDGFSLLIQEEGATTSWTAAADNSTSWTEDNKSS